MIKRLLLAVLLVGLTPLVASAKDSPSVDSEPECDPSAQVYFEPNTKLKDTWTTQGNDFISKIYITTDNDNTARLCEPEQFVLSSWNTEGGDPPPTDTQTMVGIDKLSTHNAGTYELRVPIPECAWQVDFAAGLTPALGQDLAYSWGDGPKHCDETPEPKPVNRPRADVVGPECVDRPVFVATLDNEHSDETVTFLLKLNGKTLRSIDVAAGKTEQITIHAEDGDRLQVFAPNQLAEAGADLDKCEEVKDREHKSTTSGGGKNDRRSDVPRNTAMTGPDEAKRVLFGVMLILIGIAMAALFKARQLEPLREVK